MTMSDGMNDSPAPSLLQQKQALEEATKARISDLLDRRVASQTEYEQEQEDIANELKELGYKRPRAKPQPKAETPKKTKKSVDKSTTAS